MLIMGLKVTCYNRLNRRWTYHCKTVPTDQLVELLPMMYLHFIITIAELEHHLVRLPIPL
jgi:hypothetical protein